LTLKIDRAVIEINGGCNYSCDMCPQSRPEGRGKNWLKKMSLIEFEDVVAECAQYGLNVVNLEGSGEATLNRNLPEYIKIVKKYGAKAFIFSNGYRMQGDFMKECVDAGLDFFRFSIIGHNNALYEKWMDSRNFYDVCLNARKMGEYVQESKSNCVVASYHLITDNDELEFQKKEYINLVDQIGTKAEIWKMHNWSGVYDPKDPRVGEKKTCGRPFSPDIVVRAGGIDGHNRAVHPCCQVLGRDDEAVLGHLDQSTISEVWFGDTYEQLREDHRTGNYPSYCKDCDFLVDDPEVLVWTNHDRDNYKMHGTEFDLNDYRK